MTESQSLKKTVATKEYQSQQRIVMDGYLEHTGTINSLYVF